MLKEVRNSYPFLNQAFMERMGLWGDGAPFKTFERFLDTVHKKGLGKYIIYVIKLDKVEVSYL